MAILGGDGKHRLIRLLVPSAVLPYLCFFWSKDSPWAFLDQHTGSLPTVLTYTGILPCCYASCFGRNLRIRIQVDEVEAGFASEASGAGTLGAGNPIRIVNSLPLRSSNKLAESFCTCGRERKYLSGTFFSKISDNIQPPSLLGNSEKFAVMHTPFKMIPQLNKRGKDGLQRLAAVMR